MEAIENSTILVKSLALFVTTGTKKQLYLPLPFTLIKKFNPRNQKLI
ncbi:hypothetical protein ADICYQ_3456 [Cyclobacterium qasimii M12-11B]|uniref:Uncharacterized protein n=1 Tax=Cyclobacterium qasimii M12-11B TaxID=641524 RepID=S7VCY1_9BACT|nr:hypothetical protein ADICYQ_3456 [Cyclobacterium qasimii M12-11B]